MSATTVRLADTDATASVRKMDDEHDDAVTLSWRGIHVTISLRSAEFAEYSGTDPDTVLVLVETEGPGDTALSVQVNDSTTWEGVVR